jgi:hypothetical protein
VSDVVVERIAADTSAALHRMDGRLTAIDGHHRAGFLPDAGNAGRVAGLLGAMAHGFHWL